MPSWLTDLSDFAPILVILVTVALVISRLPKVKGIDHSQAYRRRRVFNWLPLGLTYAFLYMGRYNIKVSQHKFGDLNLKGAPLPEGCKTDAASMAADLCQPLMTNQDFSFIFMVCVCVCVCLLHLLLRNLG